MHVDLQAVSLEMWKVWLVHIAERIRRKLAPFTSVYLLAGEAKVPFHYSYQCCVALAFLDLLRYSEIK